MAHRKAIYLFFLLFIFDVCMRGVESRWMINEEEDLDFEKQLMIHNKPAVKTFQSQSGHFYDCIDIYKQPAFDNPLLKDHKLQIQPSSFPEGILSGQQLNKTNSDLLQNSKCPSGTVLIRRATKNDLIYAMYHQKSLRRHVTSNKRGQPPLRDGNHYAVINSDFGEYYGSRAKLIVYGFPNIPNDQGISSQIWVIGGADEYADRTNTVEAGWNVYPSLNGNSLTHLSTYWTPDGHKSGCFNLFCQGFIVTSRTISPGIEITQLSTYGGIQESIELLIFKDQKTGNWWFAYGKEQSLVGYWPKELFNNLDKASKINLGGIVFSPLTKPSPPMGSGHLPSEGPNKTCYFTNIQFVNDKNQLYDPNDHKIYTFSDIPDYYDIGDKHNSGDPDGYQFSFGGPGGYTMKN